MAWLLKRIGKGNAHANAHPNCEWFYYRAGALKGIVAKMEKELSKYINYKVVAHSYYTVIKNLKGFHNMQGYESKKALIAEIEKTAALFIDEFLDVKENDKNKFIDGVDRTPAQMIAYQLGWLDLIMGWDKAEAEGKPVVTPCEGYKWNNLGALYQSFYDRFSAYSLAELRDLFKEQVTVFIQWVDGFTEEEVFTPGSRKWASSTPSNWPVWKWVHINSVAPFKSFRTKIRKWKN